MFSLLHKKFNDWSDQRMPTGDSVVLNHRSTYVLPTSSGFVLAGIILLMMIGATNYQNNLVFLLTFLLAGIGLVCIIFTVKNVQGIRLSLEKMDEFFVAKKNTLNIGLQSQINKAHFSIAIGKDKKSLFLCDINASGKTQIKLPISNLKRGYQSVPKLMITSQFPLGWLKTWAYFSFSKELLVYPEPIEPPHVDQEHGVNIENKLGKETKGVDDLQGLKDYQLGENLSRVDWKAYARGAGLLTKDFSSFQEKQCCFSWQDYPQMPIETILSYLTFQVLVAAKNDISYSLVLPNKILPFDSGKGHRLNCLKHLALFQEQTTFGKVPLKQPSNGIH